MVKKIILVGLLSGAFISTASLDALSFDGKISHAENVSQQKVINFSAEKIEYHSDDNMIVATGDVTLHHEKNILKADRVNFDRTTQEVKATGNISIRDGQGNIIYMEEAVLREHR